MISWFAMKKVIFLIHDLCQGGAEKVLVNLVNNMDKSKFDVTVMSLFDVGVNKQFLNNNIKYIGCFKHAVPGNSHYMKLLTPKQLYKWLVKDDYDIVISYLEGPTARIAGGAPEHVKVVSWVHATLSKNSDISKSFRNFSEAKKCYSRADIMVYVSERVKEVFQQNCPTENNLVLYNTIETKDIIEKSSESITNYNFDSKCFNWCGVGKIVSAKGFDRMLKIQKRLLSEGYNTHFHALGIGDQLDEFKNWCVENDISDHVTFWGYQTNPYKYVAKCDLYVCASYAEGFSTAATEALIVGTPVCTVDVSGMKEMLGNNNEYGIVTENDDEQLYLAIKSLIDSPSLLEHYKAKALERGTKFSTENTVHAVEEMLASLI